MNKQAYFKMMKVARLNPEYEKYIGPAAGAVIGATQGYQLAKLIHGKPGFWEKLFYVVPSLGLGVYAGTRIQDELDKTDHRLSFIDALANSVK